MQFFLLPKRITAIFLGLIISITIGAFIANSLTVKTNAQSYNTTTSEYTQSSQNNQGFNTDPEVPNNHRTYVQSTIIEIMSTISCQLSGADSFNPANPCLGINPVTNKIGFVDQSEANGGVIGMMGGMIGGLYNMPISSGEYGRYIAANFGIVKSAQADQHLDIDEENTGYGFSTLGPFLQIFTITRNIAYLGLVVVFVIIGMAIMLRIHIDPRTVMTVQNQIPKIIVGILLITFSYGIVGLLIDAMWVSTYVSVNTITSVVRDEIPGESRLTTENATANLLNSPMGYLSQTLGFWDTVKTTGSGVGETITPILLGFIGINQGTEDESCNISPTTWVNCAKKGFYGVVEGVAKGISGLIIMIALIVILFRTWFTLLKAYAYVVLDVILAPFWIIAGLLPGSSLGFGPWVRHVAAHLIVFPLTVSMILLAGVLIELFKTEDGKTFLPPLIGTTEMGEQLGGLVGLGVLLLIPEVLNMARDAFHTPASKYGGAIGAGIGVGIGVPTSAIKGTGGTIMSRKEWMVKSAGGGYEQKGTAKAVLGKLFH